MKCPASSNELETAIAELDVSLPSSEDFTLLGQCVKLGDRTTPNRFVALPMEGCDALQDGSPGKLTFRRYERMAAGGAGIIWLEACAVTHAGRSKATALYLHDASVERYRELVTHMRNAAQVAMGHQIICILQLTHSGRYCRPDGIAAPVMVRHCPVLDAAEGLPSDYPLTTDDQLDEIQEAFIRSAVLAQSAGFDGVDIKSCHGYLVSSLLGAYQREGKYGGEYDNRTRFLKDTIARIQKQLPSMLVTTRLNVFDGIAKPYGFGTSQDNPENPDLQETLRLIQELRDMGLQLLSISMGFPRFAPHYGRPSADAKHEHPLVSVARFSELVEQVQHAVPEVPVVNAALAWLGAHVPKVAAGLVESGSTSLIGQGRNSLAYPDSVSDILKRNCFSRAKACVACSGCSKLLQEGRHVGCILRDKPVYSLGKQGRKQGTVDLCPQD